MTGRVVITGAGGFVGRYLAAALQDTPWQVTLLSRTMTDYSFDSLIEALEGADAIIHLAGRRMTREDAPNDLGPFTEPNVHLTGRLMQAAVACDVSRFVFASTIAVYHPQGPTPYSEDTPLQAINAYALSKIMAEQYIDLLARAGGPDVISLRFAAIYGHGEKGTPALMRFINQANAGETLTLSGNTNNGIDQLYVRDAVSALIAALAPEAVPGTYNIGAGEAFGIKSLAETVNAVFGNIGNLNAENATDGPRNATYMTIAKADAGLRWRPGYDLTAGLHDLRKTKDTA